MPDTGVRTMLTVPTPPDAPIRVVGRPRLVVDGVEHEVEEIEVEQDVEETNWIVADNYFVVSHQSLTFTTTGNVTMTFPSHYTGAITYATTTGAAVDLTNGASTVTYRPYTDNEVTEVQRERWAAEQRRLREESQTRDRERRRVTEVAESLLLSVLDDVQRASYLNTKIFEVIGSHGGRYRIGYGTMGNVTAYDEDGQRIGDLCCHPSGPLLPVPDVMLAQMLHITTDEADFVDTANVHSGRRPIVGERRRPNLVLVDEAFDQETLMCTRHRVRGEGGEWVATPEFSCAACTASAA